VGHTRDRPRRCRQSLPCVNANVLPTLLKTVLPPNDVTALLPCFSIPKTELRVTLESDASVAHALETLAETNKPTPLKATTVFCTTTTELGTRKGDPHAWMPRKLLDATLLETVASAPPAAAMPPSFAPRWDCRCAPPGCWSRSVAGIVHALARPCARPPSPPPRPRVAALGIRVGSTRCQPPLTTGTRPRG